MGNPSRTGEPPGSPVTLIAPPMACIVRSKAGRSLYGPRSHTPLSKPI